LGIDPCVAIIAIDDVIGDQPHILLSQRIIKAPTNQALDRKQRVGRVGDGLPLGRLTDQTLAPIGKGHH